MELDDGEPAVGSPQNVRRDSQVPAVIEQWQKALVQPAQWPDAKHDVQQEKCRRTEAADQQRLSGGVGMQPGADSNKSTKIQKHPPDNTSVIDFFLTVP